MCGPRLVARLTGAAATACIGRPRGWLSNTWGADTLLEFLQKNVMRQSVEDVGHYMEEYREVASETRRGVIAGPSSSEFFMLPVRATARFSQ